MKRSINSVTKNGLKVAAVAAFAITACLIPGTAEAANVVAQPGSVTTVGPRCNRGENCNVFSLNNIFSFQKFDVDAEQQITFVTNPAGRNNIFVFVFSESLFKGILKTEERTNLNLFALAPVTFEKAFYALKDGDYDQNVFPGSRGKLSGRPTAIPENPVGGLVGAGVIGAALLLKGRKRFKRLAQPEVATTAE